MTEKRFTLNYINEQHISANIYDNRIFIGSISIGGELIVDLLNSLNDENNQLKEENQELRQYLGWQDMELEEMEDLNEWKTIYNVP